MTKPGFISGVCSPDPSKQKGAEAPNTPRLLHVQRRLGAQAAEHKAAVEGSGLNRPKPLSRWGLPRLLKDPGEHPSPVTTGQGTPRQEEALPAGAQAVHNFLSGANVDSLDILWLSNGNQMGPLNNRLGREMLLKTGLQPHCSTPNFFFFSFFLLFI